jgi:rhodanese-related sulfurtransferase
MQRLFEYVAHHPWLSAGAVAAAVAVLVYELRARIEAFAALSVTQAVPLMNQGALVIDLRTKERYDAGHIGDARNIEAAALEAQIDSLKKWREKTVITYCDSGRDGAAAARTLAKHGFAKVFNLEGGIASWVKDNMPLAKAQSGRGGN